MTTATSASSKRSATSRAQQLREGGRQLGRLDHRPVAGGERVDERRESELERVVPGRDDADHAERLVADPGARRLEQGIDPAPLRPHPARDVLAGVADRVQRRNDLEQARSRCASGFRNRRRWPSAKAASLPASERAQPLEPVAPKAGIGGRLPARRRVLEVEDAAGLVLARARASPRIDRPCDVLPRAQDSRSAGLSTRTADGSTRGETVIRRTAGISSRRAVTSGPEIPACAGMTNLG